MEIVSQNTGKKYKEMKILSGKKNIWKTYLGQKKCELFIF